MAYEPRMIAPFEGGGLQKYYKPWMIAQEAFPFIEDAYAWRGCIRKRDGFFLLGTLPTAPVQALLTYIIPANGDEQLVAFSQTKAYVYSPSTTAFVDISFFQTTGAPISWTGGDTNFFWGANYANSLWVTNAIDPLRFYNGSVTQGWNNQKPTVSGATTLDSCLIVIPYRGRLIVLNTVEGGISNPQRARWSQIGTPYVPAVGGDPAVVPPTPFATDAQAWRSDIPGRGGFVDADTNERIVTAAIIQDTLIVAFQRSTWRLRYTGNEVLPFVWERINTQLGAESTFSAISFDDAVLYFSRFGYVAANSNTVSRIDEKIPDQSFLAESGSANPIQFLSKVQGIRDYYRQMAYWAYPSGATNATSPDKVLAFNYLDQTWAIFNQSFRCFGNYKTNDDRIWNTFTVNPEDTWAELDSPGDDYWQAPFLQDNFPLIVGGKDNGDVMLCYSLTNSATDNGTQFGFKIQTKQFNPYIKDGHRCRLAYVDIYTTSSAHGQITVEHFIDDRDDTPDIVRTVDISTTENGKYTRVFIGSNARFHTLVITMTPEQVADPLIGVAGFEMQGIVLWTRREGRLQQ
jgi:hypothetical protein